MQVKDGSFTKDCIEFKTRTNRDAPADHMLESLREKEEQRNYSQAELWISRKERRDGPHNFDER